MAAKKINMPPIKINQRPAEIPKKLDIMPAIRSGQKINKKRTIFTISFESKYIFYVLNGKYKHKKDFVK